MKPSEALRRAKEIYKAGKGDTAEDAISIAYQESDELERTPGGQWLPTSADFKFLKTTRGYLREATLKKVMRLFDRAIALAEAEEA